MFVPLNVYDMVSTPLFFDTFCRAGIMYGALLKWNSFISDERFVYIYRLNENENLCFRNLRVLHGREEFEVNPEENGERWLQGCYLEWDEVRSRYRCLRNVYGREWDDAV